MNETCKGGISASAGHSLVHNGFVWFLTGSPSTVSNSTVPPTNIPVIEVNIRNRDISSPDIILQPSILGVVVVIIVGMTTDPNQDLGPLEQQ
ncbi:MAG: hypothetical protein WBZ36_17460 [Candidatus Nitrosopolaris sp.]